MIAALDWGGSWADAVLWENSPKGFHSIPSRKTTAEDLLAKTLEKNRVPLEKITLVAATGGDARKVGLSVLGKPTKTFNEFECVAAGASYLSGLKKAVAVSCGTGTAIVSYEGEKVEHLGGTGVGGGTLEGLAALLLKEKVDSLEEMALKTKETLDITVKDIVGGGIGMVPGEATASNFGKTNGVNGEAATVQTDGSDGRTVGSDWSFERPIAKLRDHRKAPNNRFAQKEAAIVSQGNNRFAQREAVARSLLHLVAETIATVASLASEKVGCNDLVFVGRVAGNKIFQERLKFTAKIFGKNAFFPEKGEYATAIGAALKASGV